MKTTVTSNVQAFNKITHVENSSFLSHSFIHSSSLFCFIENNFKTLCISPFSVVIAQKPEDEQLINKRDLFNAQFWRLKSKQHGTGSGKGPLVAPLHGDGIMAGMSARGRNFTRGRKPESRQEGASLSLS